MENNAPSAENVACPKSRIAKTSKPRVALVTGGSRGIGRAIALELAKQGCSVAINYASDVNAAEETIADCRQVAAAHHHQHSTFACIGGNIADLEESAKLYASCTEMLGSADILVHNAGITRDNLITRMSMEDFDAVLNTNLRGAFYLSKLAVRQMAKQHFGRIIAVTSVVGLMGNSGQANYAASKAGLIGLIKSLAREYGSRWVTANCVAPGFIDTRMTEVLSSDVRQRHLDTLLLKRAGTAEDVAAAVAFLASDAASYITGQVLAVDGGMSC
jgi:3-oxoacyl-[acyl-carrier protein] reductase